MGNKNYKNKNTNNFNNKSNNVKQQAPLTSNIQNEYASAPYQFISLPKELLVSPLNSIKDNSEDLSDAFKNYILNEGRESGEILLEIENVTPIFIGAGDKFFSPNGKPVIPGSSIRGMVKNLLKIATLGSFKPINSEGESDGDFFDRHLYFRCLMAPSKGEKWLKDLNALYKSRMTHQVKEKWKIKEVKNALPGFLIKTSDGEYYISPAKQSNDKILITEFQEKYLNNQKLGLRDSRVYWDKKESMAYILTGSQPENKLKTRKEYNELLKLAKSGDPKPLQRAGKQIIRSVILDSNIINKKNWKKLSDEVLLSYMKDSNRGGVDLLEDKSARLSADEVSKIINKSVDGIKNIVPCNYIEEKNQIAAFGHGQCFRIPYKNSIGDLVPKNLKKDVIDFTDAIFGKNKLFAGRIFFEDGSLQNSEKVLPKDTAHPALSPNPTSYQLYLLQSDKENLNHYDTLNAKIRGYKLYWHRRCDWRATTNERALKNVTREISPIDKGAKFTAKIRFQNLSKEELGAVLEVFKFADKGAKYKLGWGKSIGLGSVNINAKLFIEDENEFTKLFNENGWNNSLIEKNFDEYLNAYENYVKEQGQEESWKKVMDDLAFMLNWNDARLNNKEWQNMTSPMEGSPQKDASGKDIGNFDPRFLSRTPLMSLEEVRKNLM